MQTKTITFYQCETCGKDYDNADDANACELSHGTLSIERARYIPERKNDGFPSEIVITNGDKNALFVFQKVYRTQN